MHLWHNKTKWSTPQVVKLLDRGRYAGQGLIQQRRCRTCNKAWERQL